MGHPRYTGPVIDVHTHVDGARFELVKRIMESNGLTKIVNLWNGELPPPSFDSWLEEFADCQDGRMVLHHAPDLSRVGQPGFAQVIEEEVLHAADRGASGIKVWKNLGLRIKDADGRLVPVDDARLDPLWRSAGAAKLPVSIHIADPVAFFQPLDESNERYEELSAHPDWWFGGPEFPTFEEVINQFERMVARHPETTFIGVHMGCYAENLEFVGRMLDAYPNYYVDISARIGEFGRHGASYVRNFFLSYADRIMFGTDLARTNALWLPEEGDYRTTTLESFYDRHWRYFETAERDLPHPFPMQGDWTVDGIDLPDEILEQLYYGNARRIVPALSGE